MRFHLNAWAAACAVACVLVSAMGAALAAAGASASDNGPFRAAEAWAFPVLPPPPDPHAPTPKPHPDTVLHVTGSARSYTQAQLGIDHFVPDWFPQDHPPTPQIVMVDRKPGWPWPCAECHLINGAGVPATAQIGGLPERYILEQIAAFHHGQRGTGAPRTTQDMAKEAGTVTDADVQRAARYFSQLKFVSHVRVVESATVPKMHWKYFVQVPDDGHAREPLGQRIVETPANFGDYQNGSDRTRYIAYVPLGSIARGAVIAAHGTGAAASCESCHGANLQGANLPGVGIAPPLAGRSPTYIARELILFRLGRRTNPGAAPMRAEVSQLTLKDMIDVAAYAASLRD